jgi:putative peptidoglycan lipid II flippase
LAFSALLILSRPNTGGRAADCPDVFAVNYLSLEMSMLRRPVSIRSLKGSVEARALLGVVLGSLPGFLLPFALTWRLTAGHLTDAYFYAFAIALLPATLLSVVLETNVLPVADEYKRRGTHSLIRFTRKIVAQCIAIGVTSYAAAAIVGILIISGKANWPAEEKRLCIELLLIFGVYVVAVSASSVISGCLHALGDFFTTTCSQGLRSILPLAIVFVMPKTATGVLLSASALSLGEVIRAIFLSFRLRLLARGLEAESRLGSKPRSIWTAALPHGLAVLALLANPTIDRIVASSLSTGSITLLDLAEKVLYAPLVALNYSIVLVAGARWARYLPAEVGALTQDFWRTHRRALGLSVISAIVILGSVLVFSLFAPSEVAGIKLSTFSALLAIFLAGLPAAAIVSTALRFLTIVGDTIWLPGVAIAAVVINLVGDIVGARLIGVYGIALSSTGVRYANAVLLLILCIRRLAILRSESDNISQAVQASDFVGRHAKMST